MWKKEKLLVTSSFLLFPKCFKKDLYCRHVKKTGLVWERVNRLQRKLKKKNLFQLPQEIRLLKTLLEKKKMLVPSIFFFSNNVFSLPDYKFQIFVHSVFRLLMLSIKTPLKHLSFGEK